MSKNLLIIFLILSTIQFATCFKDCNFTDFRFQSKYNLGKQDQLNTTFDSLNGKIFLPDIRYPIASYINYTLTSITTSFSYIDSKQKAQIMGNDTIVIDGGYIQTTLDMKWSRKDFLERGGNVQVLCKSDEIMFSKMLKIDKGFLIYEVQDYYKVSFKSGCTIGRIDPANISSQDLGYIKQMINKRNDSKQTITSELQVQIDKKYLIQLNKSLYNQKHHLDDHFIYNWIDQKKNQSLSINYQIVPTGVDLQKDGLFFTFVTQIQDYDKWQCGATIPHEKLDVKTYGGIQDFVSLSVFQNTLKYGIQQGSLNTVLNRDNWQSNMFQFFAGDLYEVIPYIATKYRAQQIITGTCKGNTSNLAVIPQEKVNQLMVTTRHNCELYIQGTTKILQITINMFTRVQPRFQKQAEVNFYIKTITHTVTYYEQPLFKIQNNNLANNIVRYTLNSNLLGIKVFGSGWPTFKMDYPHLKVFSGGYVVFYDTSHIGQQYK